MEREKLTFGCIPMTRKYIIFAFIFTLVSAALFHDEVRAQSWKVIPSQSFVRIQGTSTVNTFECVAGLVLGSGQISINESNSNAIPWKTKVKGNLKTPVASFDCGKWRMTSELQQAMKAGEYPLIIFTIEEASILPVPEDDRFNIQVDGTLSIAGVNRAVSFNGSSKLMGNNSYRLNGKQTLLMTDYKIDPPSAILGLIKANDKIMINFEILVQATDQSSITKMENETTQNKVDSDSIN